MSGGYGQPQTAMPFNIGQASQLRAQGIQNMPSMSGDPLGQYRDFPVFNPYQAMFQNRLKMNPMQYMYQSPYRPEIQPIGSPSGTLPSLLRTRGIFR